MSARQIEGRWTDGNSYTVPQREHLTPIFAIGETDIHLLLARWTQCEVAETGTLSVTPSEMYERHFEKSIGGSLLLEGLIVNSKTLLNSRCGCTRLLPAKDRGVYRIQLYTNLE